MTQCCSRPDCVERLVADLVGFRTVNEHFSGRPSEEPAMVAYLEGVARASGLAARRLAVPGEPENLLITCSVRAEAPWVLFVSHMDTVDVDPSMRDPFVARTQDGRIYGRGACDTKGTGAAALWSLMQYASGPERPNNVALLFTVDEESRKGGILSFIGNDMPGLGWRPAGVIVCEPTELTPVVAHNGLVRWSIRTLGVSAHSSDPSRGLSSISMMVKVVQAIEARYIPALAASDSYTGKAQCSINLIRGGTQINAIPAECEIQIDRRVVPGEDPSGVLPAVEKVLDGLRREDPRLKVVQDEPFVDPSLSASSNTRWAKVVSGILAGQGLPPTAIGAKYGTEASNLAQAGIEAVVLGPGSVAQAHTADEWVSIDQLLKGCQVYLDIMRHGSVGK